MDVPAKNICIIVFMILCLFQITKCQVCKDEINSRRWVPSTYYKTVIETYRGNCWFRCTKTRIRGYFAERMVLKTFLEFKDKCCPGYEKDNQETALQRTLQCAPVCNPACQNGYCDQPGKCSCHIGYELHQTDKYKCVPVCTNGCDHGICIGPEVCRCNLGYKQQNNTCQPICNEPCFNATCFAPDKCECFSGYRATENNVCLPYCSKGCLNGICSSPEYCTCNDGWYKDDEVCKPHCDFDCGGGICIGPNICECYPNYKKTENYRCVPHCSQDCSHGICVSPENCVCNKGWLKDDDRNVCLPHCEFECGGGMCVDPNVCECYAGYVLSNNRTCIPHCPQGCPHGQCTHPGNCSCENGWYKNESEDKCSPICDNKCINGICVEANKCECLTNYTNSENGSCIPYCSSGCPNGTCVSPEKCECNEGWLNNEYGNCEPYCKNACGNGKCIKPDICECFPGYLLNQNNEFESSDALCIPECIQCNGTCLAPNTCVCDSPLQAVMVTEDGQICNCNDFCFENQDMCHHTACVLNDSYYDSTTHIMYNITEGTIFSTIQDEVSNDEETTDNILEEKYSTSYDTDFLHGSHRIYGIPLWIYIAASSILFVLVALSVIICKRQAISQYCTSSSYVVEDEQTLNGSVLSPNVTSNAIGRETEFNAESI